MNEYFFDRNLPEKLARLVDVFDTNSNIVYLDDIYRPDTPDTEWMASLRDSDTSPTVICGDIRILKNPVESKVLSSTGLSFCFLKSGWINIPWENQAWKFLRCWPTITANASRVRQPTVFELSIQGKVGRRCLTKDA